MDKSELERYGKPIPKGQFRGVRTAKEIDEDFEECCSLLERNYTWGEIHQHILSKRKYVISLSGLKSAYENKIKNIALRRAPELEKERILEDIEALMYRCLQQWNKSIGSSETIEEKGWVDSDGKILKPYKMTRRIELTGNVNFLNTWNNLLDKKMKLLGLDKSTVDINMHFQDIEVVDYSEYSEIKPITSEDDV